MYMSSNLHALYVHLILIRSGFPSHETLVKNNDLDDRSLISAWKLYDFNSMFSSHFLNPFTRRLVLH